MIFLLPVLDVTGISMLTVSFLVQWVPGILGQLNVLTLSVELIGTSHVFVLSNQLSSMLLFLGSFFFLE